jgi:hypothetical protein
MQMRPDATLKIKYRLPILFLILLNYGHLYAQTGLDNDTVIKITPGTVFHTGDSTSYFSNDTSLNISIPLIPTDIEKKNRNIIFYDSLKAKASKTIITKKLYDLVIVTPDTIINKNITGTSDASYIDFEGKKIRKIEVRSLNVFGSSITNPELTHPRKFENVLNKTHLNTNEKIIRKNLLFSEGDLISPLILSDNERILRHLPFIDDARIILIPVSNDEADILVLTKDIYSLGADYTSYSGIKKGTLSVFEKNIFGIGHELGIDIPYDVSSTYSPGFGVHYIADNMFRSFINLNLYYLDGLGDKTYGFSLIRNLISSTTKYAGGISVRQMYTNNDLNKTLPTAEPLKYNLQDYWLLRSFLLDKESVTRIIIGGRYTNNNVFDKPFIFPDSYYNLQKYKLFLGSVALSVQKYYKTNLIYGYGRTEDIPYGGLIKITTGREINEFKTRNYIGAEASIGKSVKNIGYLYGNTGVGTFTNGSIAEQGVFSSEIKYFSNLSTIGRHMIRNFVSVNYTRGFNRNTDEYLKFESNNGLSGYKSDSIKGDQRFYISLESVLFSPVNYYGFRFALFFFADMSLLSGANEFLNRGYTLSGIGAGIRIRNDNMIFKTFQLRLGFYPNLPVYSSINHLSISGEQLLRPSNFDSGLPTIVPYR